MNKYINKDYPDSISNNPPSKKFSSFIGQYVIAFSKFDDIVSNCVSILMGTEPELASIFANTLDCSERVNLLKCICSYRLGSSDRIRNGEDFEKSSEFKELNEMFNDIFKAINKRNVIVHSNWCYDKDPNYAQKMRWTRNGQKIGFADLDYSRVGIEEIKEDTETINKISDKLLSYTITTFSDCISKRANTSENGLIVID
jgi:hypothetical protein